MDRAPERDEARFLDRLGQRRMRGHPVRDRLDRRLGVDCDHSDLDQIGYVRPDSRQRIRQTLWAILISQLCGFRGCSPRWKAR